MTAECTIEAPFSLREYFLLEDAAEVRHEYADGRMYPLPDVDVHHELVASNLMAYLFQHLRGTGCRIFKSQMKLRIEWNHSSLVYYPDLMVVCDSVDDQPTFKTRPKFIGEVMTDFKKDHLEKLFAYQQIPSLEEYLVVDQNPENRRAWIYRREAAWSQERIGEERTIELRSIGFSIPLATLFGQ